MANSTQLAMPYLEAAQAQKHVTHNEALRVLDAVVMLAVLDRDLATPPGSPVEGDRYLVASGATDAWSGKDGKIAAWQDGAWSFHAAREGWRLWVADENILLVFDGASWTGAATQNAALIGVNTTADAANKLAVSSAAVLFSHAGGDVRVKLNKNDDGDCASILFRKSWSFKTSMDGSVFATGLTLVAAAGGAPKLPAFTIAALPNAATAGPGAIVYVSDESGGAVPAFSDGSDWRRITDRAIAS
jgi:hypothetical protein